MDSIVRYFTSDDTEKVISVYRSAMSTPPWNEDIEPQVLKTRFMKDQERPNFICRVFQARIHWVVWALWHDNIEKNTLQKERWIELVDEITRLWLSWKIWWFRDLLIDKDFQSQGIGKVLVQDAIDIWKREWYKNVLLRIHLGGIDDNEVVPNIKAIKLYNNFWFTLLQTRTVSQDMNGNKLNMGYMLLRL